MADAETIAPVAPEPLAPDASTSASLAASGGIASLPGAPPLPSESTPPVSGSDVGEPEDVSPDADFAVADSASLFDGPSVKKAKNKKAKKTKKDKPAKVTGSGKPDLQPVLVAVAALVLIAGGVFLVRSFIGGNTAVGDLASGDCIGEFFPTTEEGGFLEIASVSTVDCATDHAYEVFAVSTTLFDGPYPGVEESFSVGQEFCLSEYEAFVGGGRENLTTWDVWTFVPPASSWEDGSDVHCLIGDAAETTPTSGSLRGVISGGETVATDTE